MIIYTRFIPPLKPGKLSKWQQKHFGPRVEVSGSGTDRTSIVFRCSNPRCSSCGLLGTSMPEAVIFVATGKRP